jgi:hypothetical protein
MLSPAVGSHATGLNEKKSVQSIQLITFINHQNELSIPGSIEALCPSEHQTQTLCELCARFKAKVSKMCK